MIVVHLGEETSLMEMVGMQRARALSQVGMDTPTLIETPWGKHPTFVRNPDLNAKCSHF